MQEIVSRHRILPEKVEKVKKQMLFWTVRAKKCPKGYLFKEGTPFRHLKKIDPI